MHHDQIMESYIQLTPLNNYLSNCVIKLQIKLHALVCAYVSKPYFFLLTNPCWMDIVIPWKIWHQLFYFNVKISEFNDDNKV